MRSLVPLFVFVLTPALASGQSPHSLGCGTASWSNYGTGWAGTNGIPTLRASAPPVLGQAFALLASNSLGSNTVGVLIMGTSPVAVTTPLGGTLLASPELLLFPPVSSIGFALPMPVPNQPELCGVQIVVQLITSDPGASAGFSFTPGLRLLLGI